MKATRTLSLLGAVVLAAVPGRAGNPREQAALANQHLSGIVLIRRWADGLYHFIPSDSDMHCDPSATPFVDNGDGTFSQDIVTADCVKIHIVNYGGSPSDYDEFFMYPDGTTETLRARTAQTYFNGGPQVVHFVHDISTGEHIVYDETLQLDPARDDMGNPIPNLNFWYALITEGEVHLADGEVQDFTLLQTKAFDCTNIFTGQQIAQSECDKWFDVNQDLGGIRVPKPDRLSVRLVGEGRRAPRATAASSS